LSLEFFWPFERALEFGHRDQADCCDRYFSADETRGGDEDEDEDEDKDGEVRTVEEVSIILLGEARCLNLDISSSISSYWFRSE